MKENINKYFSPIKAISFKQGKFDFCVFKMDAQDLLKIAYTNPRSKDNRKGIQRGLDQKRLKEIGEYIKNKDNKPNIFPNTIIVNFSTRTKFKDGKIFIYKPKSSEGEAFILDGQHRLFAFKSEYCGKISFDLIITGFIGLNENECAYLFKIINEKQKKINPSLVYDLIPMLREDWIEFEDRRCRYFIEELNQDLESPWYDGISLLGGRDKTISQSSFITRLKSLFKKDRIFFNQKENDDFYFSAVQKDLLFKYFYAVKEVYSDAWLNKSYILCKNTGVGVLLNLLDEIIKHMKKKNKKITGEKGLTISRNEFILYLNKIKSFSFGGDYKTRYLGEAGIRELTKELVDKII